MANNKNNKKAKSNNGKIARAICALLIVGALFGGGIAIGWGDATDWTYKRAAVQKEQPAPDDDKKDDEKEQPAPDDDKKDDEKEAGNGGDLLVSAGQSSGFVDLSFARSAQPSATSADEYELKANILSSQVKDIKVDWSIDFANPSSSWASGKTASSSVELTPTSPGAVTANLKLVNPFAEQIIVKAQLRDKPEYFATCILDYKQKYTGFDFEFNYDEDPGDSYFTVDAGGRIKYNSNGEPSESISAMFDVNNNHSLNYSIDFHAGSVYTIGSGVGLLKSASIVPSLSFKAYLDGLGYDISLLPDYSFDISLSANSSGYTASGKISNFFDKTAWSSFVSSASGGLDGILEDFGAYWSLGTIEYTNTLYYCDNDSFCYDSAKGLVGDMFHLISGGVYTHDSMGASFYPVDTSDFEDNGDGTYYDGSSGYTYTLITAENYETIDSSGALNGAPVETWLNVSMPLSSMYEMVFTFTDGTISPVVAINLEAFFLNNDRIIF